MPFYIKSERDGLFIGDFLGLGFFGASIDDGTCSEKEEPIEFTTQCEAQTYLDSWVGGPSDCEVVELNQI